LLNRLTTGSDKIVLTYKDPLQIIHISINTHTIKQLSFDISSVQDKINIYVLWNLNRKKEIKLW
jgi:hypothetical protein